MYLHTKTILVIIYAAVFSFVFHNQLNKNHSLLLYRVSNYKKPTEYIFKSDLLTSKLRKRYHNIYL